MVIFLIWTDNGGLFIKIQIKSDAGKDIVNPEEELQYTMNNVAAGSVVEQCYNITRL